MTRNAHEWHIPDDELHRYVTRACVPPMLWSIEAHLAACERCRARLADAAGAELVEPGWARVDAALDAPVPGPIERVLLALRVPDHTARLLAATPALRASWLIAVASTLMVTAIIAQVLAPLVFLGVMPLVPLVGVAASFGPGVDPTYEVALVAPMHSFRLLLLRCSAVLAVDVLLGALASLVSLVVRGPGPAGPAALAALAALGWFLPALTLAVLALLLTPRLGPVVAACVAGLGWVLLVASTSTAVDGRSALLTAGGQVVLAASLVAGAVLLAQRANAFNTFQHFSRRTR